MPPNETSASGTTDRPRSTCEAVVRERDDVWTVLVDGAPALTPGGAELLVPTRALASAIASEWNAQTGKPDPISMPLTRLANSAIDCVARQPEAIRADLVSYANSDLLCYRAASPASLVHAQSLSWDPILAWARDSLGARFVLAEGVVHVAQPPDAIEVVGKAVAGARDPFALAALHVMTTLTGSVLLALAVASGELTAAEAWRAAHVDEDEQMKTWGEDVVAMRRRAVRFDEMASAAEMRRLIEEVRS